MHSVKKQRLINKAYDTSGLPCFIGADGSYVPGVYAGMEEHDYRNIDAISSTDLKRFLTNPHNEITLQDTVVSQSFVAGRYLHALLLEPNTVYKKFVVEPNFSDYKKQNFTVLVTTDDLKGYIKDFGLLSCRNNAERKQVIFQHDFTVVFWDDVLKACRENSNGKDVISYEDHLKISLTAERIKQSAYWQAMSGNAYMELTVLAYDETLGKWLKARLDLYSDASVMLDIKTIANLSRIDVIRSIEQYHYGIQVGFYYFVAQLANLPILPMAAFLFCQWNEYQRFQFFEFDDHTFNCALDLTKNALDDYVKWMELSTKPHSLTVSEVSTIKVNFHGLKNREATTS
ncbi:PD-(D/E)XK nuclease-like domain-containing protein [Photobacterium sp. ZSDE20]|uniref:PD-(D/E)XK nuclease-like domain-containing protein n=1 Tax=Photobacterium pectinilyticum TaxID=2906793 RepID=A0ABT1N6A8_9GAMM|nr:PD-(D/E)XK nuclease-like domain-containing protein [Photobacterium sp. ZSDE20]MCQ1060270.1 PD-(D/E)XK nuclease-like domain-containing protein [Photobacterium sp. ZSDE20]MDD1826257.1 PD-(D/E)XK nuclease-like domain-containing protein [Photobacterium sp. ZSDE20]